MFHHFPGRAGGRRRLPGALDRLHLLARSRPDRRAQSGLLVPACRSPRPATGATDGGYLTQRAAAARVRLQPSRSSHDAVQRGRSATAWRTCPTASTARATSGSTSTARASRASSPSRPARWFYKRNLSPVTARAPDGSERRGAFGPVELVAPQPPSPALGGARSCSTSPATASSTSSRSTGPTPGFYERDDDEGWEPFRAVRVAAEPSTGATPTCGSSTSTGDGHADVLITEDDAFVWYPSLGEAGLRPGRSACAQALDEETGPAAGLRRRHAVDLPRRHVAATG